MSVAGGWWLIQQANRVQHEQHQIEDTTTNMPVWQFILIIAIFIFLLLPMIFSKD